jgi:hypothetical protein
MVMQAARNGYFYVLDRTNGQHLLTMKYSAAVNWAKGIEPNGQVVRNPEKDNTIPGSLVSPTNFGATNWPPPSFDPQTNLFYVTVAEGYAMYYLTQKNPRMLLGLGGSEQDGVGSLPSSIEGIDYQTGKIVQQWKLPQPAAGGFGSGMTGLLTTAGRGQHHESRLQTRLCPDQAHRPVCRPAQDHGRLPRPWRGHPVASDGIEAESQTMGRRQAAYTPWKSLEVPPAAGI